MSRRVSTDETSASGLVPEVVHARIKRVRASNRSMDVTFLGTGSAMAVADRAQTGILIETDGRRVLVDCGSGVLGNLAGTEAGYDGVSSVLLTHHHLDHVSDLLPLIKARWLDGEDHLEVVGPPGTKSLVDGLLDVHDYLSGRVDLQLREIVPGDVFEIAGIEIRAYETEHSVTCHAYRFSGSTGDVTISGDSEADSGLARFADGSRVLSHDCSFPDDVDVSGHPTPSSLGTALSGADIDRVYLTHLYPHTRGREQEMITAVNDAGFDGEVRIARDGLQFSL